MNILFTICARAGSKGVKNKNVRMFLNSPLVYYTLAAYELFKEKYKKEFDMISLSINTDSKELLDQVNKKHIEYQYIPRMFDLGGDSVSKLNVIKDTLLKTEDINRISYDILVDLDLTSPLRTVDNVYQIIQALRSDIKTDLVFSMTNSRRSPFFNLVNLKEDGFFNTVINSNYVTRQEAPQCYDMNASIYAYRKSFLMNVDSHRVFDGKAKGVCVMDTAVLDIDNEEDLELMEVLAEYFYKKYPELDAVRKNIELL